MVNDLLDDSRIRDRYQFWFFTYDTGNPVLFSAVLLREALRDAVHKLDPADGKNADGKNTATDAMIKPAPASC
jgi:hypothetical protein